QEVEALVVHVEPPEVAEGERAVGDTGRPHARTGVEVDGVRGNERRHLRVAEAAGAALRLGERTVERKAAAEAVEEEEIGKPLLRAAGGEGRRHEPAARRVHGGEPEPADRAGRERALEERADREEVAPHLPPPWIAEPAHPGGQRDRLAHSALEEGDLVSGAGFGDHLQRHGGGRPGRDVGGERGDVKDLHASGTSSSARRRRAAAVQVNRRARIWARAASARAAAGFSSSAAIAATQGSLRPGSRRMPQSPTTSGRLLRSEAMTGVPLAMASRTGRPKPS